MVLNVLTPENRNKGYSCYSCLMLLSVDEPAERIKSEDVLPYVMFFDKQFKN